MLVANQSTLKMHRPAFWHLYLSRTSFITLLWIDLMGLALLYLHLLTHWLTFKHVDLNMLTHWLLWTFHINFMLNKCCNDLKNICMINLPFCCSAQQSWIIMNMGSSRMHWLWSSSVCCISVVSISNWMTTNCVFRGGKTKRIRIFIS